MLKYFFCFFLSFAFFSIGQNVKLANSFFNNGEYNKALLEYDKILTIQPYRTDCFINKIKCLQELEQYHIAEQELNKKLDNKNSSPSLLVELGYNFSLKKDSISANKAYNDAINSVDKNPNYTNSIGKGFQKYNLLSQAEETYKKAIHLNKNYNFDYQLATIYGQQNEIEKMFESYLRLLKNKKNTSAIQNLIGKFLNDDPENNNNILLKKVLLKNTQSTPDIFWNEQLSWLFVQQKEFDKAFIQEKAIFNRSGENLNRIFNLGVLSKEKGEFETANKIFNFISEQPLDDNTRINIISLLLEIKEYKNSRSEYDIIANNYKKALDSFGINNKTIKLQLAYANFLAFQKYDINTAIDFLKKNEKQSLSKFDKARFQMTQADILVADGKFNKALLNYSKIQRNLKNNKLSQEARFKVAKTSYYKGDFDWALQQLKILKSSTSQLIANDALDLHLLISDHIDEDSLNVALKQYSKADLFAFQNKNTEAIALLNNILNKHPVSKIIDNVLFLQGTIFELQGNNKQAKSNYERIINTLKDSVFVDDALYQLAILELYTFQNTKQSSEYFENIIFNHADSIHFVEAKKMYRKLRGD